MIFGFNCSDKNLMSCGVYTWTIVNAYWFIGPLQSLVLKEHWCLGYPILPTGY